jgi:hypothetical protein
MRIRYPYMRNKRSLLSALFALFLLGLFSSCSDSNSGSTTDGSTLDVAQDTVYLTSANPTDSLHLKLSCGCGFTVSVTGVSGDSSGVSFSFVEPSDNTLSDHHLYLKYSSPAAVGSQHTATLNFLAHKHTFSYTNKVVIVAGP